jgi:hypothetical protein
MGYQGIWQKETYASCIALNVSYYEAPTFYNIKRIVKTVLCHERALDLGSNNHSNSFYKHFIFRLQTT